MSITAVNSGSNIYQSLLPVNRQQIQTDFQNLSTAVQSGDMTGAQQAFAALQKDDPKIAQALTESSQNSSNPQTNALQTLASALQSGDPAAAKTALAALQQTLQGHRGRHHVSAPTTTATTAPTDPRTASGADNDGDNDGSGATRATLLNVLA